LHLSRVHHHVFDFNSLPELQAFPRFVGKYQSGRPID
jgi:hypothetical protein